MERLVSSFLVWITLKTRDPSTLAKLAVVPDHNETHDHRSAKSPFDVATNP